MDDAWRADFVNDPSRDYEIMLDLFEGDEHRASVFRDDSGRLALVVYPTETKIEFPVPWLVALLGQAEIELPKVRESPFEENT